MAACIQIIGVGDDGLEGLTDQARSYVREAELLIGSRRILELLPPQDRQQVLEAEELDAIADQLTEREGQRIVILASGDPLFYGTARYLWERLGKESFEVVPHVSSMQLAFARVKESWDDAYLTNLATQDLERVAERIRSAERVGLFTTPEQPPAAVARALLRRKIDYFTVYICENLGGRDECVTRAELNVVAQQQFSPLNVMILIRKPGTPDFPRAMSGQRLFGNADELFLQSKPKRGLLTPAEVRSLALAEMALGPDSIVWDVGAGSGAVAIEAAQIASAGQTFAIERDVEDHQLIVANAERFGVGNLTAILGEAPAAWDALPAPEAIFVGGSGRMVRGIVEQAFERLQPGGRLVVNVNSVENLLGVHDVLRQAAGDANVWMLSIARGNQQIDRLTFEPVSPTFLISAHRASATG